MSLHFASIGRIMINDDLPMAVMRRPKENGHRSRWRTLTEEYSRVRFLIVDDVEHVQESLSAIIELEPGWSVVGTATGPFKAIQIARRLKPDVILLDSELRGGDMTRLTQRLRSFATRGVVLLTTYDDPLMREQLDALGVDLCLSKGDGIGLLESLRDRYGQLHNGGAPARRIS